MELLSNKKDELFFSINKQAFSVSLTYYGDTFGMIEPVECVLEADSNLIKIKMTLAELKRLVAEMEKSVPQASAA